MPVSNASNRTVRRARPVVFLHVGTPKSGTTYLQTTLWEHRALLRDAGLCYPGQCYEAHFLATLDLCDFVFGDADRPDVAGSWRRLVEEVREWGGNAVISHELLSRATSEHIDQACDALAFADVHVVLTARDLGRQIPAAWQEDVKNRRTAGYADYLWALRETACIPSDRWMDPAHPPLLPALPEIHGLPDQVMDFWLMQDPVSILERWSRRVPAERVHVVTVPPPGGDPAELWRRFAGVLGISEIAAFRTERAGTNESLGAEQIALLRRLNNVLGEALPWMTYEQVVKLWLANRLLAASPRKTRFGLPPTDHGWVAARSDSTVDRLAAAEYDVVGDLAELRSAVPDDGAHPDRVTDAAVLDSALPTIVGLVSELVEIHEHLRVTRSELDETRRALTAAYERPLFRQVVHRLARWVPPLRALLRAGVLVQRRLARPDEAATRLGDLS